MSALRRPLSIFLSSGVETNKVNKSKKKRVDYKLQFMIGNLRFFYSSVSLFFSFNLFLRSEYCGLNFKYLFRSIN